MLASAALFSESGLGHSVPRLLSNRSMNVVMIGPFGLRPRGTMAVRALPMAQALAARGHAVTVLLPPWQNPEDAGRCWEQGGVAVENIPLPPRIPVLFHLLVALRLARRTLALRPDVVHFFKPKSYSGLSHWLLSRLRRAGRFPLVVDTDDWEGPGGWNEIGDYTSAQRRFFSWQERWGLAHADAVTVASRTLEGLVWALGVSPERVFYVPNGIGDWRLGTGDWMLNGGDHPAPSAQQPASGIQHRAFSVEHPTILLYTRFFEFPVSRVIEVLCRVRERIPAARLLVVGKGFFGEEEEMLRLAVQSGLTVTRHATCNTRHVSRFTPDVTCLGWLPPDTLPVCFSQADLAIYPFDDTLVNRAKCAVKLLDLLAAGVPVVAEAVGQNREIIRHGETGWLVAPGDVTSFAEAVVRLLDDGQLREELGRAAAQDVRNRFAWERLVETVERAYGVGQ
jgi:glycosyltransferase involved in cell wall biosynthesis